MQLNDANRIVPNPDWFEPYNISAGFQIGDILILSGNGPDNEQGEVHGKTFEEQAHQVFHNLERVLKAAGSNLQKVVKVTIYLTSMDNFQKIVELRKHFFTPPYPADTIVEVRSLASKEMLIEIDAVALVNGGLKG